MNQKPPLGGFFYVALHRKNGNVLCHEILMCYVWIEIPNLIIMKPLTATTTQGKGINLADLLNNVEDRFYPTLQLIRSLFKVTKKVFML